jgi:hypothetical protein
VIIEGVDPRDIEWEDDHPVYRVHLWHQPPAPPDIPQSSVGYHCDEYLLRGARDVHEVLDWASSTARAERRFTLYIEHLHAGWPGLIHLAGDEPTVRQ